MGTTSLTADKKLREDTVESWNTAIDDALEYRKKYGREAFWAQSEAFFYQAHSMQDKNLGPNLVFSTGDSLLSSLCVPNPFYLTKPSRMDLLDASPVLESVLNSFMYALELKRPVELACLNGYLMGRGILKLGYDSEFGYSPENDLGQSAGTILGMSLSQFDKRGRRIEYNTLIEPGMPWVENVDPRDFLVPWGTKTLRSAPWAAHRIVRHIDDVKADPKYENKKDLVPTLSMADWVKSYTTVMKAYRSGRVSEWKKKDSSDKVEFVEIWEIHDVRTGRVLALAPGHNKFLRNEIDYLQEDGLPFVSIGFVPSSRTFWTTPDAVYLQASQEEAIDIATVQRKQRRLGLLRFLVEEGSMEKDEEQKFFSGEIGVFAKYKQGTTNQQPVIPVSPPNNNQQLQLDMDAMRRDARETVGFSRNQMGEYEGTGRRTATEAGIVNQKGESRLDRRQDALAECYCDLGRKLSKIVFKFWKTPRLVEIVGQDGAAQWTAFTGSQLRGEYQYRVGFSAEPIESKETRIQRAMTLYQTLAADPTIDPLALRRMLVRAFNDPEITSLFKPGVVNANPNLPGAMQQLQQQMGGGDNGGGNGPQAGGNVQKVQPGQVQPQQQKVPGTGQGVG